MYHRIVCLTTETVETLYLLGAQDRIVGISGFTTRPAAARREKPKVSAFTSAKLDKILALEPDLVIGFSNLQADIAASLIRAGVEVHVYNQRSLAQVLQMILSLGVLVDKAAEAQALVARLQQEMDAVRETADYLPRKPRVYFEEWDAPMMSGIRWVGELIALAGGEDAFAELAQFPSARDRIIADPQQVVDRQPDIIIGSWCGKKFQPEQVMARPGWDTIPAVQQGWLREIKSADILQPGPSLIQHGLRQLQEIIQQWGARQAHQKHWS
ncbi:MULTISPECIES: cobalamin-binding protein [Methylovorus]|jgi:iron complex transport system substrate-binding protein|uniref:Periplasmic binding protein n=1 Tax=Methylovorus glucosotrophus (strain SIP3-4) TaxID=582744 RepID=C6X8C4_METGS|nr:MULTISPECIES: cobalamin-binding protein [Methylovorus]ACT49394.1 periplasmic binding protein [Methylovorus glucosotrophus SIP3-4]ADQ83343.1 periplasmic binding protein [Methylovorus sp. MP688]